MAKFIKLVKLYPTEEIIINTDYIKTITKLDDYSWKPFIDAKKNGANSAIYIYRDNDGNPRFVTQTNEEIWAMLNA